MTNIIEDLIATPDRIMYAQAKIRAGDFMPTAKEEPEAPVPADEKPFHEDYRTLDKLPKEYIKNDLLPALEPTIFNNPDKLRDADKHTPGSIKGLFFQALGVRETTKWHEHGKPRDVFLLACKRLYVERGRRISHVVFSTDSKGKWFIDWKVSGVYTLSPETGKKTHIKHFKLPAIPLGDEINCAGEYSISKPWHELAASLEVGKLTQTISRIFPEADVAAFASSRSESVTAAFVRAHAELNTLNAEPAPGDASTSGAAASAAAPLPAAPPRRSTTRVRTT